MHPKLVATHGPARQMVLRATTLLSATGPEPLGDLLARCSVAGVPLVLWHDAPDIAPGGAAIPVVVGANVGSALAEVLVHHPSAQLQSEDSVQIAWTEPGTALRKGTAVAFPDPVGMSWPRSDPYGRFVAFRDDVWSGAVVKIEGEGGERIIGAADHGPAPRSAGTCSDGAVCQQRDLRTRRTASIRRW